MAGAPKTARPAYVNLPGVQELGIRFHDCPLPSEQKLLERLLRAPGLGRAAGSSSLQQQQAHAYVLRVAAHSQEACDLVHAAVLKGLLAAGKHLQAAAFQEWRQTWVETDACRTRWSASAQFLRLIVFVVTPQTVRALRGADTGTDVGEDEMVTLFGELFQQANLEHAIDGCQRSMDRALDAQEKGYVTVAELGKLGKRQFLAHIVRGGSPAEVVARALVLMRLLHGHRMDGNMKVLAAGDYASAEAAGRASQRVAVDGGGGSSGGGGSGGCGGDGGEEEDEPWEHGMWRQLAEEEEEGEGGQAGSRRRCALVPWGTAFSVEGAVGPERIAALDDGRHLPGSLDHEYFDLPQGSGGWSFAQAFAVGNLFTDGSIYKNYLTIAFQTGDAEVTDDIIKFISNRSVRVTVLES